jgi:hypothetical protein
MAGGEECWGEMSSRIVCMRPMYDFCNTALFALTFIQAVKLYSNSDAHSMFAEADISDG